MLSSNETGNIPEILLALAKDERYVQQCNRLLKELFSIEYHRTLKGISWLLYALLVVRRENRTFGMEVCGISNDSAEKYKSRLWKLMAVSALSSIMVDFYFRRQEGTTASGRRERLRGNARRLFAEAQRETMLRKRNYSIASTLDQNTNQQPDDQQSVTPLFVYICTIRKEIQIIAKKIILELSSSTMSENGPNVVPNSNDIITFAKWLFRMQLAYFCLKGKFPIWNLLGIQLGEARKNLLANKPNAHQLVAFLILQQVAANVIGNIAKFLIKVWIRRRKRKSIHSTTTLRQSTNDNKQIELGDKRRDATTPRKVCFICQKPRNNPAIPKGCGHIFCWSCIYQWVSDNSRQECPLCRKSCKPQDILPLYGYLP